MVILEWCAFEAIGFCAGVFGVTSLSANIICASIITVVYRLPASLSVSTGVMVGNFLGSGHPVTAKKVAMLGLTTGCSMSLLYSLAVFLARHELPKVWHSAALRCVVVVCCARAHFIITCARRVASAMYCESPVWFAVVQKLSIVID